MHKFLPRRRINCERKLPCTTNLIFYNSKDLKKVENRIRKTLSLNDLENEDNFNSVYSILGAILNLSLFRNTHNN